MEGGAPRRRLLAAVAFEAIDISAGRLPPPMAVRRVAACCTRSEFVDIATKGITGQFL